MTKVVENLLHNTIIREVPGIQSVKVLSKSNKEPYLLTEGVNLNIINNLDFINKHNIVSNDIQFIFKKFGVSFFSILDLSSQAHTHPGNC